MYYCEEMFNVLEYEKDFYEKNWEFWEFNEKKNWRQLRYEYPKKDHKCHNRNNNHSQPRAGCAFGIPYICIYTGGSRDVHEGNRKACIKGDFCTAPVLQGHSPRDRLHCKTVQSGHIQGRKTENNRQPPVFIWIYKGKYNPWKRHKHIRWKRLLRQRIL